MLFFSCVKYHVLIFSCWGWGIFSAHCVICEQCSNMPSILSQNLRHTQFQYGICWLWPLTLNQTQLGLCIFIVRYLITLYQISCSYHSYVTKAIRVRILGHHNGPFGLLLGHSSCFFKGVRPSLSGPTCYPYLILMLGFDRSCISLSFLVD